MRISELASATGVAVPTIKYYLREGLLPEGERTSATQATYDDRHAQRLRVVRALIGSGVSVAETRKVIAALDDPPADAHDLLGAAHAAVTPVVEGERDLTAAEELVAHLGWRPGLCDETVLHAVATALDALTAVDFTVPDHVMPVYLSAMRDIARAEIEGVPTDSVESAVRYVVLGSVMVGPLLLALRRVAEQVASAERFGEAPG
ncbi:MerR family transcriptional regulator [Microbacterium sp. 1P10UB]|uniref:MerR family transcriptional regulator n=1 Tax=unclassified Microbacterium TaxID=2609290 RepID=UPI0039A23893